MEIHQLRYICAIADTGSFSRAAESCHVAQPSLSQQVGKLEGELSVRLFDRLGRRNRLTEAGHAFLPHARSILRQMEEARASVGARDAELRGSLSVGVIPTIAPYRMPGCTAAFARRYPHAKLRLVEATTPNLIEGLRNLSLDFALVALPLRHKDLQLEPFGTEPLFAALPKRHPRARADTLSLRELRGEDFVMLRDGHCFRDLSLAACARARISPRIAFESDQFSSLLGMVAAGLGVSLVPDMARDRNSGCGFVRLRDACATRTLAVASVRGRSRSRVQQAFLAGFSCSKRPVSIGVTALLP